VAENLLGQVFAPTKPNEVWTCDITYIATDEGWLYLAGFKDVFTCEIVGYAMGERMTTGLVSQALFRAVQQKRPPALGLSITQTGAVSTVARLTGLSRYNLACRPPCHARGTASTMPR
jgi:transposase InsO family protein